MKMYRTLIFKKKLIILYNILSTHFNIFQINYHVLYKKNLLLTSIYVLWHLIGHVFDDALHRKVHETLNWVKV